jgi:phosphoribosylformylglycinamidine synthase
MRFSARVEVRLRPGIADPEGTTIERALPALGFTEVHEVRAGRAFWFRLDADDAESARARAAELAHRLLANPVIEESDVTVEPAEAEAEAEAAVAGGG